MGKLKNLHDVSAFYFAVLAMAYIAMILCFRNNLLADFFLDLMRILDIPFALVSLIYGGSTVALQLDMEKEDGTKSPWIMVIFAACLILFTAVLFVNFAFPSQI